jgi:minor extracellular serine protease Vpr
MRGSNPRPMSALCALAASVALVGAASAQTASKRPTQPASRLAAAATPAAASGKVELVLKLADAPLAQAQGLAAKQRGGSLNRAQSQAYLQTLRGKQNTVMAQVRQLGGVETARLSKALNAVVVSIDARRLPALQQIPGVVSVRGVGRYTRDLATTVPYIGAAAAQTAGKDGTGVRVAVLDSGVDFTHRNLGGPGTTAAYAACYAQRDAAPSGDCASYFGAAAPKVVAGFDFVGETWPNGDRTEDPNPIDLEGHGTHVADIIAGRSADGAFKGVAPGAKIVAVKVCSAVASSCNGTALLKGMEFALDPNGDGDISDAVDVVNMSLGSSYGQEQDDLSEASANAVRYGVVVVASAGNSADRPYIVGSPSSTPEVISVAQTQVPSASAIALRINSPANIAGLYANTATFDWAPVGAGFTGDVAYVGRGCNADPYLVAPAGKVVLIDRGLCNISEKVRRASDAGATGILIGLVAPGDASTFSNGGQCPVPADGSCKPSLVITQADSNRIKANIGAPVNVSVSDAVGTALVGSMVASSSRGPSISHQQIKPDIGAPGASISAIAGSGAGTEAFGGTSGAAPMVSGAAAILVQAHPTRSPAEIKAALMNSADSNILTNPATLPGVLAPITRIGAGEVRVDRALATSVAAWDADALSPSLSFGYYSATGARTFTRKVTVRNYGAGSRTLAVTPGYRYANDAASGAVSVSAPATVSVPGNGSRTINVQLRVDASKLPAWNLNGGSAGGNGPLLQGMEFDGYLTLSDASGAISLPWHVLPHKASDVTASATTVAAGGSVTLANSGAAAATTSVFALTGTSGRVPASSLPGAGDNYAVIDLKAVGVRAAGDALQFAIHTHGERAHPNYPAEFDVYIDTNSDGVDDFVVYNLENSGFAVSGQNVVAVVNLNTGASGIFYFTFAELNSANAVLTVPMSFLGITPSTKITFSVYAFDNYFTGFLTDAIEGMSFTPGTPRYAAADLGVAAGSSRSMTVQAVPGGDVASPSQTGLLLLYSDGRRKNEALALTVTP